MLASDHASAVNAIAAAISSVASEGSPPRAALTRSRAAAMGLAVWQRIGTNNAPVVAASSAAASRQQR